MRGHRSTKAGPSGPATPSTNPPALGSPTPLNEGRPFRAGNPLDLADLVAVARISAQRRPALPGRQPRRGVRRGSASDTEGRALNEGRPFRAGNPARSWRGHGVVCGAQRRPALPGRQPRKTATDQRRSKCVARALNEGRPFRAGNPRLQGRAELSTGPVAQRRPALPGRQPPSRSGCAARAARTLNEGRPFRAGNPCTWSRSSVR